MHELAIAQSIFEAVSATAQAQHAAHVQRVNLRIGDAHAIVLDSLNACFEMLASTDAVLDGVCLQVESVPYRARCPQCETEFSIQNFVAQCPACQAWSNEIVSGLEFQVLSMEFEPEPVSVRQGSAPLEGREVWSE